MLRRCDNITALRRAAADVPMITARPLPPGEPGVAKVDAED
jgi:hypothetical protein